MPGPRRALVVCALAALVVGLATGCGGGDGAGGGSGVSEEVYRDWGADRRIDGDFSTAQLRRALASTRGDVNYGAFADAVQDALDQRLLGAGGQGPRRGEDVLAPDPVDDGQAASELPEPRRPDENGSVPWPFLALSALGGLLVLGGLGSSIYRRARGA